MLLVEHGLIDHEAKFELMDGAIIPMSPKGRHHEIAREAVELWLRQPALLGFNIIREHTLILDEGTIVEPDFLLYDAERRIADAPLTAADARLVIEVADSSWAYDKIEKAAKYALSGIGEYWVIHAVHRSAWLFRSPDDGVFGVELELEAGDKLVPSFAPQAPFSLSW